MAGDRVVLSVTYAALVLALRTCPVRCARLRRHVPVAAEGMEALVEAHFPRLRVMETDQSSRVIEQHFAWASAEVVKGPFDPVPPRRLPLVRKHRHIRAPRIAERGHKKVHLHPPAADWHRCFAEIDLQ